MEKTPELIDRLRALGNEHKSTTKIARALGVSRSTVRRWVEEEGVVLRRALPPFRRLKRDPIGSVRAKLQKMHEEELCEMAASGLYLME